MTLPAGLYYPQNKKINFGMFHNSLIGGVNSNFLDCISKFALNFGVVIFISMVYHKIGTFLRYFFDFANLIIPENRCFLLSMYKYICIQTQKIKGF